MRKDGKVEILWGLVELIISAIFLVDFILYKKSNSLVLAVFVLLAASMNLLNRKGTYGANRPARKGSFGPKGYRLLKLASVLGLFSLVFLYVFKSREIYGTSLIVFSIIVLSLELLEKIYEKFMEKKSQ